MPVNLSIKNVPDELADRLRQRAAANHRSLQGELMAILEEAIAENEMLTPSQLLAGVRKIKLHTHPDSTRWVREERDAR
jgi:plasmid stability protein